MEEGRSRRADAEQRYLKHSRAPKASTVNLRDWPGREPQASSAGQNPDAGERWRTQHHHTPPTQNNILKRVEIYISPATSDNRWQKCHCDQNKPVQAAEFDSFSLQHRVGSSWL